MKKMKNELLDLDRITAIQEQFMGFIMDEILNSQGEFYSDGHAPRNALYIDSNVY